MTQRRVHVFGFTEEDLEEWPSDLEPVPVVVTGPPPEEPIVVHSRALRAFQEVAQKWRRPDGRLPEAILYVSAGVRVPEDVWRGIAEFGKD